MNVVLCGMMGAGKTTVGIQLAKRIGKQFVDTDAVITQRYGDIASIFASYGEAHFRKIEREVVTKLSSKSNLIISTGGGVVLEEKNTLALKQQGKIFFLRAKIPTLVNRLKKDTTRPLLQGENLEDKLSHLLSSRAPIYESSSDYTIDVDGKTPSQIAEEIISIINE